MTPKSSLHLRPPPCTSRTHPYTPLTHPLHTPYTPLQADVFHDSLDSQASGASASGLTQPAAAAAASWFAVAPVRAPHLKGALTHGATFATFPAAGRRAAPAGFGPSASLERAMAALQAGGAGGVAGAGAGGEGGEGREALSPSEVRRQRRRGKQVEAEAEATAAAAVAAAPTDYYWEQQLPPVELLPPAHYLLADAEAPVVDHPNELRRQRRAARAQEAASGMVEFGT